jgi:hypothetical protein
MKYIMRFNESKKRKEIFSITWRCENKYDCITGSDIKDKWDISNESDKGITY